MSTARTAAVAFLGLRVAYGVGLAVAPATFGGRRWLGPSAETDPTQVALRGLGAREAALHTGILLRALTSDAPLRPWLLASIAGDAADVTATFLGRRGVPDGIPALMVAVGGGSAAITAGVAAWLDE